MSDIGPYGVTQNADAEAVTANAARRRTRRATSPRTRPTPAFGPALFSTAPYIATRTSRSLAERLRRARTTRAVRQRSSGTDCCVFHYRRLAGNA